MTSNTSLLQWLSTFHLDPRVPQINFQKDDAYYKLADGYVCANILNQISPFYFSDTWLEGITPVPPNGSWLLRVSNLKRILQKIHDYGSDLQSLQFSHNAVLPDVAVIAQNFDPDQICRLIQLILFVAINSDKKQDYIEKIQNLPTQVKQDIKEAIEQLLVSGDESPGFQSSPRQLALVGKSIGTATLSSQDAPEKSHDDGSQKLILNQNVKLQNEVSKLKEELIKAETEREEMRLESELFQEELALMTKKRDEYKTKAELAKRLQDELDEHRQMSEKVVGYEAMKDNLVKKINDLKREVKNLEEKNLSHIRKIVALEEENKNLNAASTRIDIYKKQLRESQAKLCQESHRADAAEVELARLSEKYSSTKKENERLFETTNQLMKSGGSSANLNEGQNTNNLDYSVKASPNSRDLADHDALASLTTDTVDLKERLARLECENDVLRSKLTSKRDNSHANLSGMLDIANTRCNKLESENRQARKKILVLEGRLKDLSIGTGASTSGQDTGSNSANNIPSVDNSSDNTLSLMNRVEELQRALFKKEQERLDMEAKFKRNIQKAKEVIRSMNNNQPVSIGSLHQSHLSASPLNSNSLDETTILRQLLKEREDRNIEMEREFYEFKKLKEIHERLIISAFYGLTTPMQWRNAEKRLERTTITSPPNTTSSSLNHSKNGHNM